MSDAMTPKVEKYYDLILEKIVKSGQDEKSRDLLKNQIIELLTASNDLGSVKGELLGVLTNPFAVPKGLTLAIEKGQYNKKSNQEMPNKGLSPIFRFAEDPDDAEMSKLLENAEEAAKKINGFVSKISDKVIPNPPQQPVIKSPRSSTGRRNGVFGGSSATVRQAPPPPIQTPTKRPNTPKAASDVQNPIPPVIIKDQRQPPPPKEKFSGPVQSLAKAAPQVLTPDAKPVSTQPSFSSVGEPAASPKQLAMPPKKLPISPKPGESPKINVPFYEKNKIAKPSFHEDGKIKQLTADEETVFNEAFKAIKVSPQSQAVAPIISPKQVTPLIVESAEQHVNRMRTAPLEELPQVKALLEEAKAAEKAKIAEAQTHNTVLTTHLSSISELSDEIKSQQKASRTYKALQFMNLNRGRQTRDKQIKMLKNKINDLIGKTITIPPSLDYKGITEAMTVIEDIKKQILKSEGKNTKSKLVGICESIIEDLNDIKLYSKLVSETKPKEGKKEAP